MADDQPTPRTAAFTDLFHFDDIEFRAGSTNANQEDVKKGNKPLKGLAVPYITAAAVMDRLDAVCNANGWQWSSTFREVVVGKPNETHVECTITINMGPLGTIARADVGEGHDNDTKGADTADSVKTAYSDAFKRAGVQFGIGRYLRGFPKVWVPLDAGGWGKPITEAGFDTIAETYKAWTSEGVRPAPRKRGARTQAAQQPAQRPAAPRAAQAPAAAESTPPAPNGTGPDRAMTQAERNDFWQGTRDLGYTREQVQAEAMADAGPPLVERTKRETYELFQRLKAAKATAA